MHRHLLSYTYKCGGTCQHCSTAARCSLGPKVETAHVVILSSGDFRSRHGGVPQARWVPWISPLSPVRLLALSLSPSLSARSCLRWPGMAMECSGLLIATPPLSWGRAASSHSRRCPAELSLLRVIWRCPQPASKHTLTKHTSCTHPPPTVRGGAVNLSKQAPSCLMPHEQWSFTPIVDGLFATTPPQTHHHHPVSSSRLRGVLPDLTKQSGI